MKDRKTLIVACIVTFGVGLFVGPMVLPRKASRPAVSSGVKSNGAKSSGAKSIAEAHRPEPGQSPANKRAVTESGKQIKKLKTRHAEALENLRVAHARAIRDLEAKHAKQLMFALKNTQQRQTEVANQSSKDFLYEKAGFYVEEQKYDKAVQSLQAALIIDPDDQGIYFDLAVIFDEHLNKPARAVGCYAKYLELTSEDDPLREKIQSWKDRCVERSRNP